jgi:hypothetical protein
MMSFLRPEDPSTPPLSILSLQENRNRHDPWDAIVLHHIFRDS